MQQSSQYVIITTQRKVILLLFFHFLQNSAKTQISLQIWIFWILSSKSTEKLASAMQELRQICKLVERLKNQVTKINAKIQESGSLVIQGRGSALSVLFF